MPHGISIEVDGGFAAIEFLDSSQKGPALAKLLEHGGPELIDVDTSGTRRTYIVPESIAVDAGLIDSSSKAPAKKAPAKKSAPRKTAAPKVQAKK